MNFSTLLKLMWLWPPFLGAGISVKRFNSDFTTIIVQMKMRFWNKNYVGTHFGGSMYSMTDPFYMLMLMKHLGRDYIIWDKSASIRYKKPAKGTIYATFELIPEHIETLRLEVEEKGKIQPEFIIELKNKDGDVVAEIKKILSIAKK